MYAQPLPKISAFTKPFWDACRENRLSIQRCESCRRYRFYPCASCPYCASEHAVWEVLSGTGRVYSWIVVHRSVDAEWQALAPFTAAVVEITEQQGVYIPGMLIDIDPAKVQAGMAVEICFEEVDA